MCFIVIFRLECGVFILKAGKTGKTGHRWAVGGGSTPDCERVISNLQGLYFVSGAIKVLPYGYLM